MQQAELIIL